MTKKAREVSGDRINFSGIYNGANRAANKTLLIDVAKDPYFVAIGGEETAGGYLVDPLMVLDFCALMVLIFLVMSWDGK